MDEGNGIRSFFIRGFVIAVLVIAFLLIITAAVVGTLSIVNNVTPSELIRDYFGSEQPVKPEEKAQEDKEPAEGKEPDTEGAEERSIDSGLLLEEFDRAVNEVVEKITPSVVNIRVTIKQTNIFGEEILTEGLGSGVIYNDGGYIITNNHVAGSAEDIMVTLYDGGEYQAELIGAYEYTDIAVIKIEAENLKAASFTSVDTAKVGDMVIAVGSPFGLQQTVTMGVISAKGRDPEDFDDPRMLPIITLIQTDAAINSGNSGGPLVDSAGRVIGINTLAVSPTEGSGIGLAVPSEVVVNITKQIIEFGRAITPYIGVEMGVNDTDIKGIYIENILEGYPAEAAGIKSGDIITKFNGVEVKTRYELITQILVHNVGDVVEIQIYRNGEYLTIALELVEYSET